MSIADIRSHIGTRALAHISRRDLPEGLVQTGHEENEIWLYEAGCPLRQLGTAEAWNMLNPERPLCLTS
ncbi:MAG: hypothetical protein O9289_17440 [Rhodobacteraceae bacterium]|nr:hypothetical protein [Paracoccaceae bacterium]MCZ8084985.1 hypothetical protein [Paracoccaceae bacterium]